MLSSLGVYDIIASCACCHHLVCMMSLLHVHVVTDLGRFRIRSRNQRTNLNPNPDLIPDSESCVVESDLESESCRFKSESDSVS